MRQTFFSWVLTCALVIPGCRPPLSEAPLEPGKLLAEIEEDVWQHTLETIIEYRVKYGLPVTKLPDISLENARAETRFYEAILARLEEIPEEMLTDAQKVSASSLRWQAQMAVESLPFFGLPFIGIPYSYPNLTGVHQAFQAHPLGSRENTDRYLALFDQYPDLIEAMLKRFEDQAQQNIVMPRAEIDLTLPLISSYRVEPEQSPLYPNAERLAALDAETVTSFRESLKRGIDEKINPAFDQLVAYLNGPYREQAPTGVGVTQYPDGEKYYRFLVRNHTSLDLTPEDIHQRGLHAVAEIKEKIGLIKEEIGFQGSEAAFREMLDTDPRFFAKSPEEVGVRLMSYIERLEPVVDRFFERLPKAPYGVARLPESLEGSMTFGYYQWPTANNPKGVYLYNGSKLEERTLLIAESLIYHELVPGHHFQLATQYEAEGLSQYRRENFHTAYVEGWAEYASGLGTEMGGYRDPYDRLGRCFSEMFFAVRLVVDTGMNGLGWSRQRAMDFMKENLLESDTQIETESLRYAVAIPGQALAYRIGSEKIRELRAHAEQVLGERFDLRRFHAAVLENGSVPLTVLEQLIERFIEAEKE